MSSFKPVSTSRTGKEVVSNINTSKYSTDNLKETNGLEEKKKMMQNSVSNNDQFSFFLV